MSQIIESIFVNVIHGNGLARRKKKLPNIKQFIWGGANY